MTYRQDDITRNSYTMLACIISVTAAVAIGCTQIPRLPHGLSWWLLLFYAIDFVLCFATMDSIVRVIDRYRGCSEFTLGRDIAQWVGTIGVWMIAVAPWFIVPVLP